MPSEGMKTNETKRRDRALHTSGHFAESLLRESITYDFVDRFRVERREFILDRVCDLAFSGVIFVIASIRFAESARYKSAVLSRTSPQLFHDVSLIKQLLVELICSKHSWERNFSAFFL